jgi:hypothetical protein
MGAADSSSAASRGGRSEVSSASLLRSTAWRKTKSGGVCRPESDGESLVTRRDSCSASKPKSLSMGSLQQVPIQMINAADAFMVENELRATLGDDRTACRAFNRVRTAEAVWTEAIGTAKGLAFYPTPRRPLPKLPRVTSVMRNKDQTPFAAFTTIDTKRSSCRHRNN